MGVLQWETITVRADAGDVRLTVTGNVDTRVATRFFWLPKTDTQSEKMWDRTDGESLFFDVNLIRPGQNNHLGFVCQAAPVIRTETNLVLVFQVRQGDQILREETYRLTASEATIPLQLVDGITLAI